MASLLLPPRAGLARVCGFKPDISPPRSCDSQPKISKTTPCEVAGSRRHRCALGKYLTRRANQRHCFIIAQSVKRPWPRNGALFGAVLSENSYPQLKLHWHAAASDRLRVAEPPRF